MNITPKAEIGQRRFLFKGGSATIRGAFKSAVNSLREEFGGGVRVYRVDFSKYQVCIGGVWYQADLNISARKFEIIGGRK